MSPCSSDYIFTSCGGTRHIVSEGSKLCRRFARRCFLNFAPFIENAISEILLQAFSRQMLLAMHHFDNLSKLKELLLLFRAQWKPLKRTEALSRKGRYAFSRRELNSYRASLLKRYA